MLTLDQVKKLENHVDKAVGTIQSLTTENTTLRNQLTNLQQRVLELEQLVQGFKDDQGRIEEGILSALNKLSAFEDSLFSVDEPTQSISEDLEDTENHIATTDAEQLENEAESLDNSVLESSIDIETEWDQDTSFENEQNQQQTDTDGQMDIF